VDRSSDNGAGASGCRTAAQERRRRPHRWSGKQELIIDSERDVNTNQEHRGVSEALSREIVAYVQSLVDAMGMTLQARLEETPEAARINLDGDDGGFLIRGGGQGLQALQHLVATTFRKQLGDDNRIVVDCNGFRRDKDAEIRQMAHFVAEKARASGIPQEMGPLNPYERRIVHLAIAEDPTVSSESIGDAFMKTVIISARR
jgi:spoIIIJ-associated protein